MSVAPRRAFAPAAGDGSSGDDAANDVIEGTWGYSAPKSLDEQLRQILDLQCRPVTIQGGKDCQVCSSPLSTSDVQLETCGHSFHRSCLEKALRAQHPSCPLTGCHKPLGEPRGKSPSGSMKVSFVPKKLSVHPRCNAIQIKYVMESGTQKEYHPSPLTAFRSTVRTAYLPNNDDGRVLLKRLKYAFLHGLTFTIGTSLTSGMPNVITWSSIHHKTSLTGGIHGYPDPSYICNCTGELDHVGVPSASSIRLPPPIEGTWSYSSPSTLTEQFDSCIKPVAPLVGQDCSICLSSLSSSVVQFLTCEHFFHETCLKDALKHQQNCPMCRKAVGDPQGKSPSGTMIVSLTPNVLGGFECDTIQIDYWMPGGTQKAYHPSPGTPHPPTARRAYLPNNEDGRLLLERLKYAFVHGLTFTVGTSVTTGKSNVITWTSIHHKTSLSGGAHGYPDPRYFHNCNDELDTVGVPPASGGGQIEPMTEVDDGVYNA